MRVLLDENLPRKLKGCFSPGVEVVTVPERGWSGMKNGALLSVAEKEFDLFISMDAGIPYQQNLQGRSIGVILLSAVSNQFQDLLQLMPQVNAAITHIKRGEIVIISG